MSSSLSNIHQQQQLILRLPDDLAGIVRKLLRENESNEQKRRQPASSADSDTPKIISQIDVKPEDPEKPSNNFTFSIGDDEYPALLSNLPTPVESHKTFNNKIFLKSADIGQVLHVFHSEKERESHKARICKTTYGDYNPHGLTPPTQDIVERRFDLTRKDTTEYMPYKIRQVVEEISLGKHAPWEQQMKENEKGGRKADNAPPPQAVEDYTIETVEEEVVSFEEWMLAEGASQPTGLVFNIDSAAPMLVPKDSTWTADQHRAMAKLLVDHADSILVSAIEAEEDALADIASEQKRKEGAAKREEEAQKAKAASVIAKKGSRSSGGESSTSGETGSNADTTAPSTTAPSSSVFSSTSVSAMIPEQRMDPSSDPSADTATIAMEVDDGSDTNTEGVPPPLSTTGKTTSSSTSSSVLLSSDGALPTVPPIAGEATAVVGISSVSDAALAMMAVDESIALNKGPVAAVVDHAAGQEHMGETVPSAAQADSKEEEDKQDDDEGVSDADSDDSDDDAWMNTV